MAWLVIPEDDGTATTGGPASRDATTIAGIVLLALAVAVFADGWWWTGNLALPLLLIGTGAWLLLRDDDRSSDDGSPAEPRRDDDRQAAMAGGAGTGGPALPAARPSDGPPVAPPPPRPTSGGPPTGRITAALVALLGGTFGLAIASGADISAEVILLSCLTVIAGGLVVGAFTGRARGLVPLAVPFVLALVFVSAVHIPTGGGIGDRRFEPVSLYEVADGYELTAGTLTIDLRHLSDDDLATLRAGEPLTIDASVGVGELDILTPPDVTVQVDATVSVGQVDFFGDVDDGTDVAVDAARPAGGDAPVLHLDLEVGLGEVTVR